MSFRIVRNDITKMNTEAIVNTANRNPIVGSGCDYAIYKAAGHDTLLAYRKKNIGVVEEGDVFITPGFDLQAKYILHAVSPLFTGGTKGEEEKLRSCYKKSLLLAKEHGMKSIAFPLISTGSFGYPKEEGMRIAVDEIHAFLLHNDMNITLVVFDEKATRLGGNIYPDLEAYIDKTYVEDARVKEYAEEAYVLESDESMHLPYMGQDARRPSRKVASLRDESRLLQGNFRDQKPAAKNSIFKKPSIPRGSVQSFPKPIYDFSEDACFEEVHESKLNERMRHMTDTFSEYLMYLIKERNMENAEVYKRAIVDKKIFSKIKNNVNYHPNKLTALCLCVGARLNLDETKDLLARAGYALSPCDKTDIIFSYFIENEIYDMIELDIQLEEHGLPCIIS